MSRAYGEGAALLFGPMGLVMIWQGVTGNVPIYPLGDCLVPRWLYILAGITLLGIPVLYIFLRSETGLKFLGATNL